MNDMISAVARHEKLFGRSPEGRFFAPGRTELCGNHTDHQHGLVLAAPIGLEMRALASRNDLGVIRMFSEGFGECIVELDHRGPKPSEFGRPSALVRGVAEAFADKRPGGVDIYLESDVPAGSGLSSSAAMEILLARLFCALTGTKMSPVEMALLGHRVENRYFGKPCGLMDQLACASDGIVFIDLQDPENPEIQEIDYCPAESGYSICIVNSGAGHENMTDSYAAITTELGWISGFFGKESLRDVPERQFLASLKTLRRECGDRAVLRAMHVYDENRRVTAMADAMRTGDTARVLKIASRSGDSSWELLQNVIPAGAAIEQDLALAISLAKRVLAGRGAVRVHGGGFAGTLQAYVPTEEKEDFTAAMESVLGRGCCTFVL